jgi:hypothetical protein
MKFFKNTLPIILLFFVNFVNPKSRGATVKTSPQPVMQIPQQNLPQQSIQSKAGTSIRKTTRPAQQVIPTQPAPQSTAQTRPVSAKASSGSARRGFEKPSQQHPSPATGPQQITPIQPITPQKILSTPKIAPQATNNVVMALDPRKKETIHTAAESLVQQSLLALYQKAAPVIMTNNILEIILTVKQRIGDQNLQRLRTADMQQMFNYAQQLAQSTGIAGIQHISVILLSGIDFNNINFYFHKSENITLLIPKEYIAANVPKTTNANMNDQAKACGFNPDVMRAQQNTTTDTILKQLQVESGRPVDEKKFLTHLASMFTIQKKSNGELIHPEGDNAWIMYIIGHGSPAFLTIGGIREQYTMYKNVLANPNAWMTDSQGRRMSTPEIAAKAAEYEKMLQGRSAWADTQVIPESAQIAGITGSDFAQLMTFFDEKLNTAYVHYISCFSGGSNQTFVNETLSSLKVHFIVSTQGIQEGYTSTGIGIQWDSRYGMKITGQDLAEFFKLLRTYFTQQKELKIEGKSKDPIRLILATLISDNKPQNQPFVRMPETGAFIATPVSDSTETITKEMARLHETQRKSFDFSDPNINVVIISAPRVNAFIDFGKKGTEGHTAIVTPSPASFLPGYEAINKFREINWQDTLQALLFNLSYLNARLYTQTFVIKTVRGVLLQQSGLQNTQGAPIKNLIVQMKSVSGVNKNSNRPPMQLTPVVGQALVGSNVGLNINVAFECGDTIYQAFVAIQDFERPDELSQNMDQIKFTATPKQSININTLANVFLTLQEVTQIKKPITLQTIAEFIDAKIDKQDPSMAITSDADNKALRDFVSKKARRRRHR